MVAGNDRAGVKACLHLTHLLLLGHTSRSFPNRPLTGDQGFSHVQPFGDRSYSSHHSILPPRLPVCVLGVCGYMHAPVCTLWLVAVLSWRACALEGQNRLLCVDGGAQEASVENFKA